MMKIIRKNKIFLIVSTVIAFFGSFAISTFADATAGGAVAAVLGWALYPIIWLLGQLLLVLIDVLVGIAKYNTFIKAAPVDQGWTIVRDICNMGFIVIFLVIAFATILRIESYNWKKAIPKLIVMAILINFSKTICGLIISIAQVVMLTFVYSFQEIAGANFTTMLGIDKLLSLSKVNTSNADFTGVAGSFILALIYVIVSIIVILSLIGVLLMRMVYLWIYIVLSPVAYLGAAFPQGKKYATQWWSEFSSNVIVGPVLALFIWLSFASMSGITNENYNEGSYPKPGSTSELAQKQLKVEGDAKLPDNTGDLKAGLTEAGTPTHMMRFIISIGMLIGGMMVSQSVGARAGSAIGKGMSALQKGKSMGVGAVKRATGYDYASGVAKSYISSRKAAREDKIKLGAQRFTGAVGAVQKSIGDTASKAGIGVMGAFGLRRHAKRAEEADKQVKTLSTEKDDMMDKVKAHKPFEKNGFHYDYDSVNKKWIKKSEADAKTDKDDIALDLDKFGEGAAEYTARQERYETFTDSEIEDGYKTKISAKQQEAEKERRAQKTSDKWAKAGMAAIGGGLGLATGGGALVPLLGMAAGGLGVPKLVKGIKDSGNQDLGTASNYHLSQITKEKDTIKNESNEKVRKVLDDINLGAHERIAAIMEAISRKMIDQEDIKKYKEYAQQKTGSKKEADGSYKWKDNKVGNQFDALLEKSGYIMQSPPINDLDNADVAVSGPAQRKVRDKYESGSYTMKDLDVKVLEKSINELADGLKTGKFLNQFKDLDAAKQSALINALKKAADGGNASAKEKLAHIKGIDYGFKEDEVEAKQKFTRGLTISDLNKIIAEGNAEQNDALVKAVNGQMTNLASQVQRAIMGGNKQAVAIKDILGIK